MNRKAFQIRRNPSIRPVDPGQKPLENQSRVFRQHSPDNIAATSDNKPTNLSRKLEPNPVTESKQATENEKLPRSAPLNQSKRLFRPKTEIKEGKEVQRSNLQSSAASGKIEYKNNAYANASRHSRVAGNISEENRKGVVVPKREKGSIGKPPIITKRISEEAPIDPFDVSDVNAVSLQYGERNASDEADVVIMTQKEIPAENTSKQMEFTLAGFTPPRNQTEEKEMEKLERSQENGLRLQDDSLFGEQINNVQLKNPTSVRGLFAKEHIPTAELIKLNEQKKLMKEYLDYQMNEKKKKKEEEKKREAEFHMKEEQRIKKEIKTIEYQFEKEVQIESEKKSKFQVPEIKRGGSPQLMVSSRESRRNVKDFLEQLGPGLIQEREQRDSQELKKSQEKKEFFKEKLDTHSDYIPEEQIKVEKLVEENMQLRNENSKKMEIIDILLNALKQKEQGGISSIVFPDTNAQGNPASLSELRNTGSRFISRAPEVENVSDNTKNIKVFDQLEPKYISSPKNFKFNHIETFNEDRQFQPFRDNNLYLSNTRLPLPTDPTYMSEINKFNNKATTPARGVVYKMFTPNKKDQEYLNHIKSDTSPRGAHIRNMHGSGLSVPGSATEASRAAFKNKNTLLPGLGAPSSSQLPYRSNLMNNGDQIVNGIKHYDNFRLMEGPFKKEEQAAKVRTQNILTKQSQSETILKRADNVLKAMNDIQGNYNFNETFYPNPVGETHNHLMFNGSAVMAETRHHPTLSMKAEVGMFVLDDGSKHSYQSINVKEREAMKNMKSQGNIIGMGTISVVDMANNNGLSHTTAKEKDYISINEDAQKLYIRENGGISERKVGAQGNESKMKFPKEVFSINVKKKFYG